MASPIAALSMTRSWCRWWPGHVAPFRGGAISKTRMPRRTWPGPKAPRACPRPCSASWRRWGCSKTGFGSRDSHVVDQPCLADLCRGQDAGRPFQAGDVVEGGRVTDGDIIHMIESRLPQRLHGGALDRAQIAAGARRGDGLFQDQVQLAGNLALPGAEIGIA